MAAWQGVNWNLLILDTAWVLRILVYLWTVSLEVKGGNWRTIFFKLDSLFLFPCKVFFWPILFCKQESQGDVQYQRNMFGRNI